ncbi:caspase family protein [Enterobacter hormaechei]|uniref:caspase family protein n=1 Tax=Enterobacter hormaechei TaxID=158836 RepID=UPI000F8372F8|nr:caspase family protein [Enterobacter hormaechei]RTP63489.1 caspase family protein [Enterobacter hormaechei]
MNLCKLFPEAHALIIAISEYEGGNALPYTVTQDALDVAGVLMSDDYCGYNASNVTRLINSDATLINIRNALSELTQKAGETDTVFIYFSGHGANLGSDSKPDCSLVPVDFSSSDGGLLGEEELSYLLSLIKSERLLFVIDACHSAGVVGIKNLVQRNEYHSVFSNKSLERLSQGRGKVLLASSRDTETSLILPGDKNSLFTKHFLDALKGAAGSFDDNFIRVFDIFTYLESRIPTDAKRFGEEQHPVFKSNLENNFPVALKCGGVKKMVGSAEQPKHAERDRRLEDILADLYPAGPSDQDIWQRAGGDISRLKLSGTGRAQWFAALRVLRQGGGGEGIHIEALMDEVRNDFPNHHSLL